MALEEIDGIISRWANEELDETKLDELMNTYDPRKVLYCLRRHYNVVLEEEDRLGTVVQRNDANFKKIVRERFSRCIICEPSECHIACCQVAHIWGFADCDSIDRYNPDNGLLMCANIHLLFDNGLIRLEPVLPLSSGMVRIICDETLRDMMIYKHNGQIITLLPENMPFLLRRYDV